MHKSQLAGLIIDCQTEDVTQAAEFWSQALGLPISGNDGSNYVVLETAPEDPYVEVQRVEHPSRVHLDIETDDIEAEVARLETLGAKRVREFPTWWVMKAPTGQRFCVVPVQRSNFANHANQWGS